MLKIVRWKFFGYHRLSVIRLKTEALAGVALAKNGGDCYENIGRI
jgi:hypothetical protein